MFIWSLVLFGLGVLAVLDSQLNYGYLFRSANSFVFLLVSLGLLIRTRMLERFGFKEKLLETNQELRKHIEELASSNVPMGKIESKQEVPV